MNAFQAGQLVAWVRSFEDGVPEHITVVVDRIEADYSGDKKTKKAVWTDERRAEAAARMSDMQKAKKENKG